MADNESRSVLVCYGLEREPERESYDITDKDLRALDLVDRARKLAKSLEDRVEMIADVELRRAAMRETR